MVCEPAANGDPRGIAVSSPQENRRTFGGSHDDPGTGRALRYPTSIFRMPCDPTHASSLRGTMRRRKCSPGVSIGSAAGVRDLSSPSTAAFLRSRWNPVSVTCWTSRMSRRKRSLADARAIGDRVPARRGTSSAHASTVVVRSTCHAANESRGTQANPAARDFVDSDAPCQSGSRTELSTPTSITG